MLQSFIAITILGITGLVFVVFLKESTIFAKKELTYQTKVIDRKKETTLIVVPIFVPIPQYYIIIQEEVKIKVNQYWYDRINVGDIVKINRYSNGLHEFETIVTSIIN